MTLTLIEKILLAGLMAATAAVFARPILLRLRLIRAGRPLRRTNAPARRAWRAFGKVFLQRCTLRSERRATGVMHGLIFYAALTFDLYTVTHVLEGFRGGLSIFGEGLAGRAFSLLADLFVITVLTGVAFFAVRRFVIRPKAYATTPGDSALIYAFITLATLTFLYAEAFAIALHPGAARLSFLGAALARGIAAGGLSDAAVAVHARASWWLHTLAVFAFIAYVPRSKYLHMFAGPFNVFFRREEAPGYLAPLDLENSERFGLEKAVDFTWKDNLDAFACMECGRCQDVCPAFASDKPLSPKMILFNQERHLLAHAGLVTARRAGDLPPLVPDTFSEDEIWTCTTCGACMHVCPVEIEHIPKIVGARQARVLMEGRFPHELNAFFRGLETNGNPWNIGRAERAGWSDGLDVPLLGDRPDAEYLFWVGCMGAFDEAGKKTARATVSLLRKAGVSFAVLGAEERCCGESARKLGHEHLFQVLAARNYDLFLQHGVKRILTICPHGYTTFKHDYPALLDVLPIAAGDKDRLRAIEVVSHVDLLRTLLADGRLKPAPRAAAATYTIHDSCYLARHNGLTEEPRAVLGAALAGRRVELRDSRAHGFCCGAGGGLMWIEEKLGRRVNRMRTAQVLRSGAELAATSCPFCLTMLRDGLADEGRSDIRVDDIARLLDESVPD